MTRERIKQEIQMLDDILKQGTILATKIQEDIATLRDEIKREKEFAETMKLFENKEVFKDDRPL